MLLFVVCASLIHALLSGCVRGGMVLEIPELSSDPTPAQVLLPCGEMFHLINPRNCCNIPYLLPPDVVQPCLQTPLAPVPSENCRAECVLKRTKILIDGQFQMETAMSQFTMTSGEDRSLTNLIQYAITKCHQNHFYTAAISLPDNCTPNARLVMDCIFAITYRKCPAQYWTDTDTCNQLVRTLNDCSYFLVYSDNI